MVRLSILLSSILSLSIIYAKDCELTVEDTKITISKDCMTGSYLLEEGKKEAINGDTIKSCTKEKPCQAIYCKTDEYTCTEAVHLNSYTLFKMDEKTLLTCNESKCYPIDVEGFYLNGGLDRQTNPVIKCDKNNGCKNIMYADIKSSCEDVSIGNIIHVNDDKYYYCASKKNDDKIQIGGTEEKVLKTTIPVGSTHPFTGEVLQTGTELVLKSGNNALTVVEKDSKDYEKATENKPTSDDTDSANTLALSLMMNLILAVIAGAFII